VAAYVPDPRSAWWSSHPDYTGRAHFFGVAARVMRQILVDHARTRQTLKRGGDEANLPLTDTLQLPERPVLVVALDEALNRLTGADAMNAEKHTGAAFA